MEVFYYAEKTILERKDISVHGSSDRYASGTHTSSGD